MVQQGFQGIGAIMKERGIPGKAPQNGRSGEFGRKGYGERRRRTRFVKLTRSAVPALLQEQRHVA